MHSKQRQRFFACPMCDHKSNDVNNMKRHINTVHNSEARRVYRFVLCSVNIFHRELQGFLVNDFMIYFVLILGVINVTFSPTKKLCCCNTDTVLMRV